MNQIIQKAVEELSSEMVAFEETTPQEDKALKRPQMITAIFTQKLTEAYMAGRSDVVEFIRETCLRTGSAESFKFVEGKLKAEGVKLGDYVVSEEFLEQAKQPVKDNN